MKLYYVGPDVDAATMDEARIDSVVRAAVEPIADVILGYFRADGISALIGLEGLNPPYPATDLGEERHGRYRVVRFETEADVRAALVSLGDAYSPSDLFCVRSVISCRSVTYGYDGQAFICLRTEDEPPIPIPGLIRVEERPDILIETDYMDGAEQQWPA
jgi:hypothetical protein